jgi:hypothetical protein
VKTVKLIFFSLASFLLGFVVAAAAFFLRLWVDFAVSVPARSSADLASFIPALQWAVVFSLYTGILFTVNYAFRKRLNRALIFVGPALLFSLYTAGSTVLVDKLSDLNAEPFALRKPGQTLGQAGLMLYSGDEVVVLLDDTRNLRGSRVYAPAGEPLVYQSDPTRAEGDAFTLPPVRFKTVKSPLFDSVRLDFAMSARTIAGRYADGVLPFIYWTAALVCLQVAVSFIFNMGIWPLSNLFLGAALLRGILALDVFINSDEVQIALKDFARGVLPDAALSPVIFGFFAVLLLLYLILLYFTRGAAHHAS